jgi:beta-lactam-binding protein with PASTA domain
MVQGNDRRRFWKRVIAGVVILFVVLPVVSVIGIAIFRSQHAKTGLPQTIVPNLKGLDLKTAEAQARQARLNPQVLLRRWDIPAPIGTIVGQEPEAGDSVAVDTLLGLEVCIEDPDKALREEKAKTPR